MIARNQEENLVNLLSEAQHCHKMIVLASLPHSAQFSAYYDAPRVLSLTSAEQLPSEPGYLFAPFAISAHTPIYYMCSPRVASFDYAPLLPIADTCHEASPVYGTDADFASYAQAFNTFHQALEQGCYDKLVLSRSYLLQDTTLSLSQLLHLFFLARSRYPQAYATLTYLPAHGWFVGATPEVLLQADAQGHWHTIALAGTRHHQGDEAQWSAKNCREQAFVTDYLVALAQRLDLQPISSQPYTYRIGDIEHLRSDITFVPSASCHLGSLLSVLHPTPAVCGLPKESAFDFIARAEGYSRGYYTGFMGYIDAQSRPQLFVNLRCMHYSAAAGVILYAGGGLLAASELATEWAETNIKLHAMGSLLQLVTKQKQ